VRKRRAFGTLATLLLVAATPALAGELVAPLSDGTQLDLPEVVEDLPAPPEVLGYPLGTRFTHWAEVVGYLERLAAASPRVTISEYGRTWEGRPLVLLAISSPANIARLESVRDGQRLLAAGAEPADEAPVVVWLGYGVHGNEPSSTEAAVATAYLLAAAGGEWADRLQQTVVLIDPLSNPDGRERYVHFFESRRGRAADPLADAAEHWEPWPGGRQNHYLIDLNRDWAWATQPETRARLATYRDWEPQVHVDFHEMSAESTYFFPPPAEPINAEIGDRAARWARQFGEGNATAFDRYGWIYYNGERYDLYYPGYGDTYPSLRGAVGMTYEMAGHGRAGEALRLPHGGLLALADRVARHLTTSLATVATAAAARAELLADFAALRRAATARQGRTYLWEPDQPEAAAAAALLERHGAEVGRLGGPRTLPVRPLAGGGERARSFPGGTWAVNSSQPLGALIRALMELDSPLPEEFLRRQRRLLEESRQPEFSDITAWSIPLAFNLETWAVEGTIAAGSSTSGQGRVTGEGKLGFLVTPQGLDGFRLTAALMASGLRFRVAVKPFSNGGHDYPAGTVFVPRVGNPSGMEARLAELSGQFGVSVDRTATAFSAEGISLGSEEVVPVRQPKVALIGGGGVSATSYGAIWHLLDRDLELPHHRLETRTLSRVALARFDLLILPAGFGYDEWIDDATAAGIGLWVEEGGLLVAVGGAIAWLRRHELTDVKVWRPWEETEGDHGAASPAPVNRRLHTPGAALATELRADHPLAAGLRTPPAELFVGREILLATGDPRRDVLRASANPMLAGFAWPEALERLEGALLVGIQPRGKGAIVLFAQEPAFRLFWRAKLPLFLNTVMLGPSLNEAGWLMGR
jgi:hypothetical protein